MRKTIWHGLLKLASSFFGWLDLSMDFKGYSKVVFLYKMSLLKQKMFLVLGEVKFWVQGFLGVLLEALGISLSFNFCRQPIIAVT